MTGLRLGLSLTAIAAALLTSGCATQPAEDWSRFPSAAWPANGGDWNASRYSALSEINAGNLKSLAGAWIADLGGESVKGSPVMQDGMLFVATTGGHVVALDARTGKTVWSYKPATGPTVSFLNKGVSVGGGLVFFGLADASIAAIDEKTGRPVWTTYIGDGPRRPGMAISAAPAYAKGLVISGLGSGDAGIRGRVVALDAKTGKQVWQFDTTPGPGEPGNETWPQDSAAWRNGGAGVWMTPSIDPELGLVYFGTGNAAPQYGGEVRPGDNLYAATAIALDLQTGKMRWHFQTTHHDIWEADLGTPLVLYDSMVDGHPRKAIAILRTDGYLFLLDRVTGAPIIPVEERPVRQNARLATAPTQPYPVGAESVGPRCVPQELVPPAFKLGCVYDPVDYTDPNTVVPTDARNAPMSYSPDTGYFYVSAGVNASWIRRADNPYFFIIPSVPGLKTYGVFAAIDSRTDRIVWQKRFDHTLSFGGGSLATKGGLVFHEEPDGNLDADDVRTGENLWRFQTGSYDSLQAGSSVAGPLISYAVDGEQYVVKPGSQLWAFKLGGPIGPQLAPKLPPNETQFSGRIVTTNKIEMTATLHGSGGIKGPIDFKDEYAFQPVRAKLKAGDKVTWTNTGKDKHSATAIDGSWSTGEVAPGKSVTLTFKRRGTYTYICKDHPWSYGQLIVE